MDVDFDWEEILDFVRLNSTVVRLEVDEMAEAEPQGAEEERIEDFGFIDSFIILKSSRKLNADLLTGDPSFSREKDALSLDGYPEVGN